MKNQRIIWVDSLKGLLMILVVFGHAIQCTLSDECNVNHAFNLIYSFHMPAFMAISGWFAMHSKQNWGGCLDSCLRRCKQLLVPYVLWSLIQWLLENRSADGLLKILYNPDSFFWFLWVLFWISCLFTFCKWMAGLLKVDELLPVAICAMVLMGVMVGMEFRLFGFQFLAYYFIFYTLGYCVRRFSLLRVKNNIIFIVLAGIWFFLAWYWQMHALPSWFPAIPQVPSTLLQYAYRGLTATVAVLVLFGAAPILLDSDSWLNSYVKGVGRISLGLYVVHLLIIGYLSKLLQQLMPAFSVWAIIMVLFAITFMVSIVVVRLIEKIRWTALLLLGKD